MAQTAAAINAVNQGTFGNQATIIKELPPYGGTLQYWYVVGKQAWPGKSRRISTTASDDASTQAAAIRTELAKIGNAP